MQWAPLALLWAAWGCEGRIRNDGADELFVEYEDYELPDNETGAQHSLIPCARTPPHPTSCSVHRAMGAGAQRTRSAGQLLLLRRADGRSGAAGSLKPPVTPRVTLR